MRVLMQDEAAALLSTADLKKLEAQIAAGALQAELINGQPVVTVRKHLIPLFVILSLLGTL